MMANKKYRFFLSILTSFLGCFLGIAACGGVTGGGSAGGSAAGILYVLDDFNDAVYVFDNATTINGSVSANRTISGSNTQITDPSVLAVDGQRDILYVADSSAQRILVFIPASERNGNVAPTRSYTGLKKGGAVFYDSTNDRLYVTDIIDGEILVWDSMSNLVDGTGPTRTIGLGYIPSGMAVDHVNNLIYVGDPTVNLVKVYTGASTLAVNATADHSFSDSTNSFANLNSITINAANNLLFVAESSIPSVEMFDLASTLSGAVPSTRQLTGSSTGLTVNLGQAIFASNVIYVLSNDTLLNIWNDANQLTGNDAPNRSITVSSATSLVGLALDLSR